MNKNLLLIGAALVVLLVGGFLVMSNNNPAPQAATTQEPQTITQNSDSSPTSTTTQDASGSAGNMVVKELTVSGSNFKFIPATLAVNKGDKVKITFKNTGGTHDFVIDAFNIKTKTTQDGVAEIVEFVADKTGTFEYYCSIGNHKAMGMKGILTVQ